MSTTTAAPPPAQTPTEASTDTEGQESEGSSLRTRMVYQGVKGVFTYDPKTGRETIVRFDK